MNLAILGGVSADKLKSIISQQADNITIFSYADMQTFMEQTSIHKVSLDRMLLMQDAYLAAADNKHMILDNLMGYLGNTYPQIRIVGIANEPQAVNDIAEALATPYSICIKPTKVNSKFIMDVVTLGIEDIRKSYSSCIATASLGAAPVQAPVQQFNNAATPAPANGKAAKASRKEKKHKSFGDFGTNKTTSGSNAGNAPAAPLSTSQNTGFAFNAQAPSGSPFASNGQNPFNNNQNNSNPFAQGGQNNSNPFAQGNAGSQNNSNPFAQGNAGGQSNPNPFASGSQGNSNPFASGSDNSNPFASGSQGNSNPFASGSDNSNPFASGNQGGQNNPNPFESSSNPFASDNDTAQNGNSPFAQGNDNSQSSSNPFASGAQNNNPFASNGQSNSNPFTSSPVDSPNPFAQGNAGGQESSNPFAQGSDASQSSSNPFANSNPFVDGNNNNQNGGNPFAQQGTAPAQPASNPFEQSNPFAQQNNAPAQPASNPFEQSNPFAQGNASSMTGAAVGVAAAGNPFDVGNANEQTASNPFEQSNPFAQNGNPAPQEQSNPFAQNNPFAQQEAPAPQAQANPFEQSSPVPQAQVNPFEQSSPAPQTQANQFEQNNPFAQNNATAPNQGTAQPNPWEPASQQNTAPAQASINPFEQGNPFTQSSQSSTVDEVEEIDEVSEAPVDTSAGFANAPFMPYSTQQPDFVSVPPVVQPNNGSGANGNSNQGTAHTQIDMQRLQAKSNASQYDFRSSGKISHAAPKPQVNNVEEIAPIVAAPAMGFVDDSAYQSQFAPAPKVVERIVEREVYIDSGSETPAVKLLEAGKFVTVIVTGDRRSGVTYTALNMASLVANRYSTLLVDLDTETFGGQLYQDIQILANEEENRQWGLHRCKTPTLLGNLVHHDNDDNFDYLFSMIGNPPATDNEIRDVAKVLVAQRIFQFTVIDCPWSKLHLLEELLLTSKIVICVDPDITGCHNAVELLNDQPVGSRIAAAVERAGGYVAKGSNTAQSLISNMQWINETFEATTRDWSTLKVLGTNDKNDLYNVLKKI